MSQLVQCKPDSNAVERFVRAMSRSLAYLPFSPQSRAKRGERRGVRFPCQEVQASQIIEIRSLRTDEAAKPNKESLTHDLARIKANGSRALIKLMMEKELLPPTADGETLYREAPLSNGLIKSELNRSGLLDNKMFCLLGEQLVSEDPDERRSAANLLGAIVLDTEQGIVDDEIRKKAISTLVTAAIVDSAYNYTRIGSSESLDMLKQLSFSIDAIKSMQKELEAPALGYVSPDVRFRKLSIFLGLGIAAGALIAGLPLAAASIGALPPLLEIYVKTQKERAKLFFHTRKRKQEVTAVALNEIDQFQKLLSERQNVPQLPQHEQDS